MTYDALIVGAGPIGIELGTVLSRAGFNYLHLEAGPIGSTITRWPRNTRFFSSPEWISIAGIPIQTEGQEIPTGEAYLAYLRHVVEIFNLSIQSYEPVMDIQGARGDFTVRSTDQRGETHEYRTRNIVLATGDMNAPRLIGIPGEELPHVTHLWQDPHLYFQRKLLIVGGRNSAVEAALRCWRAGVKVAISYRGSRLDQKRLISRLHLEIDLLIRNRQIDFHPNTVPVEIRPGVTVLDQAAQRFDVPADFVYLATGFEMDQRLYEKLGIAVEGQEKRPVHDERTMESSVPGVYIAGTATGGNQRGYKVFITTSHIHCLRIARGINPGATIEEGWVGNHQSREYPLSSADVE
jgi:bacillithiol disulfide reductase